MSNQQPKGPVWGSGTKPDFSVTDSHSTEAGVVRVADQRYAEERKQSSSRRVRLLVWLLSVVIAVVVVAGLMMLIWSSSAFAPAGA